jgi:lysophospholipase L1-like esterase
MVSPDRSRRARLAWAVTGGLVALAVAVPAVVLVADEAATHGGGTSRLASGSSSSAAVSSEPSSAPGDPTASAVPTTEPAVATKGRPRALMFGDSYFIGGGYTDETNSMAQLAANRLGWDAEINGGGGTGFVGSNPEYGLPDYLGQIEDGAFDVGRRSWVVIEGGNNDLDADQQQVARNARKVLRIAQRRFPRARVVLVGPMDTDGDYANTTPVTRTLRKAAKRRGVPFVDARRWLAGNYDLIGPDYTHPYPEGHRICARKLTRALRRLGA